MDKLFLSLGALLGLGLLAESIGRRTALPRVTLLMLLGLLLGRSGFDLLPEPVHALFPAITHIALLMLGFVLGEQLALELRGGKSTETLLLSLLITLVTAAVVTTGLVLAGLPVLTALLLGGVATATDPAATADVIMERRDSSRFSRRLIAIVAIDDAWGLVLFSLLVGVAQVLAGQEAGTGVLAHAVYEIGGAVVLGLLLSVPVAWATGRIRKGEPSLLEGLSAVFLCGGLALWLELSFLLAAMTMGAAVAVRASHHQRPFHAIERVQNPFLILFFLLAGASLEGDMLLAIGVIGVLYIALRVAGRLIGGWLGGGVVRLGRREGAWLGMAMLPQAGVAVGMALIGAQRFPEAGAILVPIVIGSTILFELVGPAMTGVALRRAGTAKGAS